MEFDFKKNIFLVTSHFSPRKGGVETGSTQYLDFAETNRGLKFVVLTYESRHKDQFIDYWQNSKVIRVKVPLRILTFMIGAESVSTLDSFFKKIMFVFLHVFFLLKGAISNWKELKKTDIIFANGAIVESIAAYILSLASRKKLIIRWHVQIKNSILNFPIRIILRLCLRRATKIGANDENTKDELIEIGDINNKNKVFVSKNPVDTEVFYPVAEKAARGKLDLPDNKIIVLFAAIFNKTKLCDLLIETAHKVIESDKDFLFIFIGGGPMEDEIIKLEKLFPQNIKFIRGLLSQSILSDYINAVNIVFGCAGMFFPGRLVLESLACGVPVLLPNIVASHYLRGEKIEPKFKIQLPHIFLVNPKSDYISSHLLQKKIEIQNFRSQKNMNESARGFILENYSIPKLLKNEIKEFTC